MPLDNVGMWNIGSENWVQQYLGQQFYLRVYSPANSWRDEYPAFLQLHLDVVRQLAILRIVQAGN